MIKQSSFKKNYATISGGALQFTQKIIPQSLLSQNFFFSNQAKYGNNFASYPVTVSLQTDLSLSKQKVLFKIQPGLKLEKTLEFSFYDHFNQIVFLNYSQ